MGICCSCHSTSVATAKLILPDGSLQEFSSTVKVSDVLRHHPSAFICNSDEMDFDDVVSAIKGDDELQPGQLYFALPLARLKHPLQPEEMAALAVKASGALAKCGCRRRRKNICFTPSFSGEKGWGSSRVADAETIGSIRRSCGGDGGKRQNFKVMLSAIPE
ncbi:uncharacterized protein LOC112513648 [Cynara cardunculus var. scolymus]|uniref:Uncharacterized protein n=1 Tax=Cynara cardunculus var. scolymus TaxID=59895 RepID=A0A103Y521_CYNCS|nr:uncharacterized protein LOC112513648 [Cynara cardunculus var. scolymus]KVI02647.1 Protein of unknown function DUF4228 [Cynara cardunculus var. scolymus]